MVFRSLRSQWLFLILSLASSCGPSPINGTTSTAASSLAAAERGGRFPDLRLTSEWRSVATTGLKLKIGVKWPGFALAADADSSFRVGTDGSVTVIKSITSTDSKLVRDGEGHFDATPAEPVTARCRFRSQASVTLKGGATFSMAGATVDHETGEARVIEVESTGKVFSVTENETLATLEKTCETTFVENVKPMVERDLAAAISTQFQFHHLPDERLDAVHLLLSNQAAAFDHRGYHWRAEPLAVEEEGGNVVVRGHLAARQVFSGGAYDFTYRFDGKTLAVLAADISPRDFGERPAAAMELAAFLARTGANWHAAAANGKPFTIDASSLGDG